MTNPVLNNSPIFGAKVQTRPQTTPAGYPTMPGYAPGQFGQAPGYGQATAYGAPTGYDHPQQSEIQRLNAQYAAPAANSVQTGRMSYDDVIMRTGMLFGLLLVTAVVAWIMRDSALGLGLTIGGAVVAFVLGLVNAFKREPSPLLISLYALAEGLFLGGISGYFEDLYPGIVMQAVLATFVTFMVTLLLFKSGKVRVTPKFTRFVMIATLSYGVFCLVNFGLMITNTVSDPWGLRGIEVFGLPLGVVIGVVAVILATMSLLVDFDAITKGVVNGAPRKYAWSAAFGLMVTIVWLYIEFLRILAIMRDN
ncbi:Bax inhibitor-1/YccA family protein [Buchananella hordeovulneris]|uniref:Bax inhibitor-1/YccA family protein n=1 Tax=Buchananella hordeovulneris TaxID=52770 RepID=UPI0026DAFDD1|nr:Bax inhibitor-1/YccA family protein [Buchananella hordeovulneris]MDO5081399.1 Bax inhibitor-1/YccA family protein [Buchananella hordeovulneris]